MLRFLFLLLLTAAQPLLAQQRYELHTGWRCQQMGKVAANGAQLSQPGYALTSWLPAVVPGTVLTTQLANRQVPDPFYGMNNERIPDIYRTGRAYYTYWFAKDFVEQPATGGGQVWLHLRGVNYSCEVFLNGRKLNAKTHYGMFLRQAYNVTPYLARDGRNRLAVLVYPPDPVGNPNGGQGGDGTIARNVAHQYVAGWDWIRPIRDRNTGIWDQVTIERTGALDLRNPHVVTRVPGVRRPAGAQAPATVAVSAELVNATDHPVAGVLRYTLAGRQVSQPVRVPARTTQLVRLPALTLQNPRLWWPNGYGQQPLYPLKLQVLVGQAASDEETVQVGVREIGRRWNERTRSMQVLVNGQPLFIKGGNWIISDALLRFTPARYDAEIRFHRDMNLNLIRVWGGALVERPDFYAACDHYGLLVMQDFWMSGDANGRWEDPAKLDDQWARRRYPDDHRLFVASAADQIKLVRNHPSLALWCGGNEITPPADIYAALQDTLLPGLDGTRWFIPFSNADSMSVNTLGGSGDGPYGIQPISYFWGHRTFPFNSEIGSVGTGDYESLARFLPPASLQAPPRYLGPAGKPTEQVDSVWAYHHYISYEQYLLPYGAPTDARDFGKKAQLVNYDQYRALMEGFSARMNDWYTGSIIWKTQNPWTALRGQMYDYYLDPNACLYGLRSGSELLHVMYNPVDSTVLAVNNGFDTRRDLMLVVDAYDMAGQKTGITQVVTEINPSLAKNLLPINRIVRRMSKEKGMFLSLQLLDLNKQVVSRNLYWLPDASGQHSGLQGLAKAPVQLAARSVAPGQLSVRLRNPPGAPVAFFTRLSLLDPVTQQRILPVFYSDNYVSVLPGETRTITLDYPPSVAVPVVAVEGWNVEKTVVGVGGR